MEEIVPVAGRTRLLPLWRVMGWLTGALLTIWPTGGVCHDRGGGDLVDHHYEQQIVRLMPEGEHGSRQVLVDCQADEVSHRDEAASLAVPKRGVIDYGVPLWGLVRPRRSWRQSGSDR